MTTSHQPLYPWYSAYFSDFIFMNLQKIKTDFIRVFCCLSKQVEILAYWRFWEKTFENNFFVQTTSVHSRKFPFYYRYMSLRRNFYENLTVLQGHVTFHALVYFHNPKKLVLSYIWCESPYLNCASGQTVCTNVFPTLLCG